MVKLGEITKIYHRNHRAALTCTRLCQLQLQSDVFVFRRWVCGHYDSFLRGPMYNTLCVARCMVYGSSFGSSWIGLAESINKQLNLRSSLFYLQLPFLREWGGCPKARRELLLLWLWLLDDWMGNELDGWNLMECKLQRLANGECT